MDSTRLDLRSASSFWTESQPASILRCSVRTQLRVDAYSLPTSRGHITIPAQISVATTKGDDSQHARHMGFERLEIVGRYCYRPKHDDSA